MRRSGFTGAVLVAVLFSAVWVVGQEFSAEGPYLGQEPPGMTAEVFAPDLVSADQGLGCSGFLDDGRVFVFSSTKKGMDWRFSSRPPGRTESRVSRYRRWIEVPYVEKL